MKRNNAQAPQLFPLEAQLPQLTVDFKPLATDLYVKDSHEAFSLFSRYWEDSIYLQEKVYAIFMNNARLFHGCKILAAGSYRSCDFDEALLYGLALASRSTKIIIAHNHTTGKTQPSERDKVTTQRVKDGCDLLGIKLVDHLIIGLNSYYSFADNDIVL